jgi:hypothetical protein
MPISLELLKKFKNDKNIDIYFETGMSKGNGIKKAIECNFNKIYSIDICKKWIDYNKKQFSNNKNITLIHDDSQNLDNYIKDINEKTLFFLDAHNDHSNLNIKDERSSINCPIFKELEIIKNHHIKDHLIIVDDVRIFKNNQDKHLIAQGGEFKGTKCDNWGLNIKLENIEKKLIEINSKYKIKYINDQLIAHI